MVSLLDFKGIYMGFTTYQERRQIEFSPSARLYGTKCRFTPYIEFTLI